ncbi:hypothetical protein [Clostridium saudiense]|nr:hypothetical protein [Clostridium saudiense]
MVKVFGIGNILLKDDGIGVRLARNIKRRVDKVKWTLYSRHSKKEYLSI